MAKNTLGIKLTRKLEQKIELMERDKIRKNHLCMPALIGLTTPSIMEALSFHFIPDNELS